MLTRRGWSLGIISALLLVSGRLAGIPELYALAVAGFAVLGASAVFVATSAFPHHVEARREVKPPQVHAGGVSRVELAVRNRASSRSPVLSARDPFDRGRRWARFQLAPLLPGEQLRAAYRLPTSERGVFPLGPLEIALSDPFGLVQRRSDVASVASLTVYPHVDEIRPLFDTHDADPSGSGGRPLGNASGEDFYALRPYQVGDDLRRVHWASTARLGELMIRQHEVPWQSRVTVAIDLREAAHTPESLERVLSAAASIVHVSISGGRLVRLVASNGVDTGLGGGHTHLATLLEHLAAASLDPGLDLSRILTLLTPAPSGGAVVVTTTAAADAELRTMGRALARYGSSALVVIDAWRTGQPPLVAPTLPKAVRLVRCVDDQPFAPAWDRVMITGASALGGRR